MAINVLLSLFLENVYVQFGCTEEGTHYYYYYFLVVLHFLCERKKQKNT